MNLPSSTSATDAPASRNPHDGLPAAAIDLLLRAERLLLAGRLPEANVALRGAMALAPRHAEVERVRALLMLRTGQPQAARELLEAIRGTVADSPDFLTTLAEAQFACDDQQAAFASLRRVCEIRPDSAPAWLALGKSLMDFAWTVESLPALERAVELDPANIQARTLYADVLVLLGRFADARKQFLEVLERSPACGPAWWGLANIKTVRLTEVEVQRLESLLRSGAGQERDRLAMGCVLGKAYEDHGRPEEAFAILTSTNKRISERRPWDPDRFSQLVDLAIAEFTKPHSGAIDSSLGEEVIFIVSLPRSGSTLTEHILAAHPDVEGASELGELSHVLQRESERRRVDFPYWITDATAEDWARLGSQYLEKTARWRSRRPRSTDKMPNNWYFVGAIRAMLPGARIINCRRDPVETCWSCFKQMFSVGNEFSYDLGHLARLWRDYDRMMRFWHQLSPNNLRDQIYEELVADPESETRALLDFCQLEFNEACLRPHEAQRSVRTASAAQVREPIQRNTARTAAYGALLDPLRKALSGESPSN